MQPPITITCETVASEHYCQRAAKAVYIAIASLEPENAHLQRLEKWSETGGYFPVVWSSCWAVDVPLFLNSIATAKFGSDEYLLVLAKRLLMDDNDVWQLALSTAEKCRKNKGNENEC